MRITVGQLRRMIREAINEKIDPSKGNFRDVYFDKEPKSKDKGSALNGKKGSSRFDSEDEKDDRRGDSEGKRKSKSKSKEDTWFK
jgi:hypothetical protein